MTIRNRITVTGKVQGVGFRASCAREAQLLGVAGTVRNRPDGAVEVLVEGDETAVAAMTDWCRVGPTYARVVSIDVVSQTPTGETTFRIVG